MDMRSLTQLIADMAKDNGIDPDLALAIASHESGFDTDAVRYEESWTYLVTPYHYAALMNISEATETVLQKMSWNCLQVMGGVCRELGYQGHLINLTDPKLGIHYGCLKLANLKKKYTDEQNLIAAYNAGTPGKLKGVFRNQKYVNAVLEILDHLRRV